MIVVVLEQIIYQTLFNMAACRNCGKQVGCGCQLNKGLCGACYSKLNKLINFCKNAFS